MQLSLPAANFPTPAAAPACTGKTSAAHADSPETPADSFDSLLTKDQPKKEEDATGDNAPNPGAEQAAGILAALMWMQVPVVATTPPPTLPAVELDTTAVSTDGCTFESADVRGKNENAVMMPFSALTSSRAFASLIAPDQVTVPTALVNPTPVVPNAGNTLVTPQAASLVSADEDNVVAPDAANVATIQPAVIAANVNTPVLTDTITATPVMTATLVPVAKPANVPPTKASVKISDEANSAATSTDGISLDLAPTDTVATTTAPAVGGATATAIPLSEAKATAANDAKPGAGFPQEKIALPQVNANDDSKSGAKLAEKYFLQPVQKAVTAVGAGVGIAVAKVNAAMSAATSARTKSAPLVEPATFVFSAEAAPTATFTVDAPAPVATVRETLAAVISAVDALERRADVQQKSVDLQFHIGSEKLGLRVELKDGMVHTTFRTESPEMNHALAREWHSLVPTGFGREIKLADPVYNTVATSGSDSSSTSLGQGAQHQREQQKAPPTFASALKREFYDSAAQETAAPVTATTSNSSQLLNALA